MESTHLVQKYKKAANGTVDEPLQVIEFIPTGDSANGETQIKLRYDNLESILKPCGDRPLSIITVCGPPRTGKSFLLGYMIRRLEALEKGKTDWMGWDQKKRPLGGFKFRNGNEPESQGVWMWSRPFIIKSKAGKEVCVLLMDTQGPEEKFITTKEISAILGLSLLTSSVLILNFINNLPDDILATLCTYIQPGLLALDSDHFEIGNAPFQKLIFLIRDWNNIGMFPFGRKGGEKFLKEKLELKPEHPKEAKELREPIRKGFQDLDCFLMPHIGEKALSPEFTGSISDLNNSFRRKLQEFIGGIINVEDIVIKEIRGELVTANEFIACIEIFVKTIKSKEMSNSTILFEAHSKAYNKIQIQKAWRKYVETVKQSAKGAYYLTRKELLKAHEEGEKAAKIVLMTKIKKHADFETLKMYRKQLTDIILSSYEQMQKQNEDRRCRFISEANNDSISTFRNLLEKEFPLLSTDNETVFYEEPDIRQAEKRVRSQVLDGFQIKLTRESVESLQGLRQVLNRTLDVVYENLLERNESHRLNAEKEMHKIVKGLVEDYRSRLADHFQSNKFEDLRSQEEFHDDMKTGLFESFHEIRKPGGKQFHKQFSDELGCLVDEAFQAQREKMKVLLKDIEEQARLLVAAESNSCIADVDLLVPAALLEFEQALQLSLPLRNLSEFYEEALIRETGRRERRKVLVVFMHKISDLTGDKISELIKELDLELEKLMTDYIAKNNEHRKESEQLIEHVVVFLCKRFESSMNSTLKLNTCVGMDTLSSKIIARSSLSA